MTTFSDHAKAYAARRLAADGIWVKREFWADEYDNEVPEGHPDAVNRTYMHEVDYDRIVERVVAHLAAAPKETADWPGDPNLTAEQKLDRFESLGPEPTQGPNTETPVRER